MNCTLSIILAIVLDPTAQASLTPAATALQNPAHAPRLVHVSIINMSGQSREAHIRTSIISLPVATSVTVQVAPGDTIRITSSTNRQIARNITITSTQEGHLLPIN